MGLRWFWRSPSLANAPSLVGQTLTPTPLNCKRAHRARLRNSASGGAAQHVADAGHGAEPARLLRIIANLLSQTVHELLEQLPIPASAMTPDMYEQSIRMHNLAGIGQQQLQ